MRPNRDGQFSPRRRGELFAKDIRNAFLAFGDPTGVVLQDHVFRVANQFRNVAWRNSALQEQAYERMPEHMWSGPAAFE